MQVFMLKAQIMNPQVVKMSLESICICMEDLVTTAKWLAMICGFLSCLGPQLGIILSQYQVLLLGKLERCGHC